VLQLHKTDGGHEYAEFLHAPRKRFTDFGKTSVYIIHLSNLLVVFTIVRVVY
jgi:hypothetical protein